MHNASLNWQNHQNISDTAFGLIFLGKDTHLKIYLDIG